MDKRKKIVISRTDSIGDVVLTLPMTGIIKRHFPESHVIFLGNTYTRPIIECCEHVDETWEWAEIQKMSFPDRISWLKAQNIDTFIHVFPNKIIAKLVKKAGIPMRIGTSHRVYHTFTCNKRPNFTRKRSDLHEAQLNIKLLKPLGIIRDFNLDELYEYAGFSKIPELPEKLKQQLSPDKKNVILHPKSKGSAVEWGVDNFMKLAKELDAEKFKLFFTGTEDEAEEFRSKIPKQENIVDLSGQLSLDELIAFIAAVDTLVAASTGPLHIAGVLGVETIGLFPTVRPTHAGRWKPLGPKTKIIEDKKKSDLTQPLQVDLRDVVQAIKV